MVKQENALIFTRCHDYLQLSFMWLKLIKKKVAKREKSGICVHNTHTCSLCYSFIFSTGSNTFEIKCWKKFISHNYCYLFWKILFEPTHEPWAIIKSMFFQQPSSVWTDFIYSNQRKVQIYLGRGEGEVASKFGSLPVTQMPHFVKLGSPLPAGWWLSAGGGRGAPSGCECRDKIRKMLQPQTEGRRISLGFSLGWLSR